MKRCGVVVLLLCGFCVATVYAKPGVVKTRDGQTYAGEIDETSPDSITVTTAANIPTAIPRNLIATI